MEKQRWEESEKRKSREKVEKSRFTVLFQWFVAPEGRNAKAAGRCCGAKHISKSKCAKHLMFGPLLEVEMSRRCGAKHILKSKCAKHTILGAFLEVEMFKKCTPLLACSTFGSQKLQNTPQVRNTFGNWDVQKVHAAVARSTCRSQHVQNTQCEAPKIAN